MAAPSGRRNGSGGANLWVSLLLAAVALRPVEAVSEPTTVAFDVRPGGVVHSFSQNVGPGSKAAFEKESDVPLKNEEFEVTKTAVSHRPGAFKAELSKLVIVAKATRSEL
ncbi:MYDGF [Cervus elaphus hippelaphus]|uniref:MYDGF n=1 Tax=Cervus elaphus hippelaphus TaxID=46360 RepID=A0A212D1L5_CEREH|nr:MYDGF [Cervus elaphus hippelaphus]